MDANITSMLKAMSIETTNATKSTNIVRFSVDQCFEHIAVENSDLVRCAYSAAAPAAPVTELKANWVEVKKPDMRYGYPQKSWKNTKTHETIYRKPSVGKERPTHTLQKGHAGYEAALQTCAIDKNVHWRSDATLKDKINYCPDEAVSINILGTTGLDHYGRPAPKLVTVKRNQVIFVSSALQALQKKLRDPTSQEFKDQTLVVLKIKLHLRADHCRLENINAPLKRNIGQSRHTSLVKAVLSQYINSTTTSTTTPNEAAVIHCAEQFLAKEIRRDEMVRTKSQITIHSTIL